MIRLLIPVLLALAGLGSGIGAGLFLRFAEDTEDPVAAAAPCGEADPSTGGSAPEGSDAGPAGAMHDYVKLNNQFVVPVVKAGEVVSLVVLSLSLEVKSGATEAVYAVEPKLRDGFLQVMFDHANAGGFDGAFTDAGAMDGLRHALRETARKTLGAGVTDILITDIIRQDT